MKPILLAFLLLISFVTVSFGQSQKVSFTTNVHDGCAPLTTVFTNTSTGYADTSKFKFEWHFYGTTTSSTDTSQQKKITHIYKQAGTFNIIYLYVYNRATNRVVGTSTGATVNVYGSSGSFEMPDTICPGQKLYVSYSDYSEKDRFNWDFGNGDTSTLYHCSTQKFMQDGIYPIKLYLTHPCGYDSIVRNVVVTTAHKPLVKISYFPHYVCAGLQQSFGVYNMHQQDSLYDFHWDLGDGTVSSDSWVNHTYNQDGTYVIKLTATNQCGNTVTVIDSNYVGRYYQFQSMGAHAYPTKPCMGDSVEFNVYSYSYMDNPMTTITWQFNNMPTLTGNGARYAFKQPGIYKGFAKVSTCNRDTMLPVEVQVQNCTSGVPKLQGENSITIFPNPLNTTATIEINAELGIKNAELRIYNVLGQEVLQIPIVSQSTQLDRGKLPDGMYFYEISTDKNIVGKGKLIIQ